MTTREKAPAPQQQRSIATRAKLLDAAVDELVERGYAAVTTSSVAHRAGVTRGAQQHHFPTKEQLVAEAVRHFGRQRTAALESDIRGLPDGPRRVGKALDLIYAQYSGPVFAATLELALAARHDVALESLVEELEQQMAMSIESFAETLFKAEALQDRTLLARWSTAIATIRGLAMLLLLGHPERMVSRQWRFARGELTDMLESSSSAA